MFQYLVNMVSLTEGSLFVSGICWTTNGLTSARCTLALMKAEGRMEMVGLTPIPVPSITRHASTISIKHFYQRKICKLNGLWKEWLLGEKWTKATFVGSKNRRDAASIVAGGKLTLKVCGAGKGGWSEYIPLLQFNSVFRTREKIHGHIKILRYLCLRYVNLI